MKVQMKVVLDTPTGDLAQEVTADARDIRAYESEFGASFLTTELSMTQLTQLAYVTMKRTGRFTGTYQSFDSECVEVESVDEEAERLDPTPPGPGEDPLSH